MIKDLIYYSVAPVFIFMIPAYRYAMAWGKPFSCLYCFTFWLCVLNLLVIPFAVGGDFSQAWLALVCPVLATLLKKYIDSLPTLI